MFDYGATFILYDLGLVSVKSYLSIFCTAQCSCKEVGNLLQLPRIAQSLNLLGVWRKTHIEVAKTHNSNKAIWCYWSRAMCNLQIIRTSGVAPLVRGWPRESQQDIDPSSEIRVVEEEGDLDLNHLQDTILQKKGYVILIFSWKSINITECVR